MKAPGTFPCNQAVSRPVRAVRLPPVYGHFISDTVVIQKGVRGVWTGKNKKVRDQKEGRFRAVVGDVPNCLVASLHSLDYANFRSQLTY